jgi:hypothetical protein
MIPDRIAVIIFGPLVIALLLANQPGTFSSNLRRLLRRA